MSQAPEDKRLDSRSAPTPSSTNDQGLRTKDAAKPQTDAAKPQTDAAKPQDQGPRTKDAPQAQDQGRGEAAIDMADLKRKSVRGGMVTMASQGVSIVVQLASTVILARLLTPDDYGTIAMVLAITAFAGLFRDLGLSSAAIQKKDLTDAQQSNLFWLNVAMGAALTVIVAAASPLVGWFYGKPELIPVTIALSFSFLIGSLGAQHTARLIRDMQFGRKAAATISGSLVTLAVAVACALNGLAYWALVWGNLAGAAVTTLLLFLLSPFWPGWYQKGAGIREMLKFGAHVTAFDFVNYFHRNLDNILIGRFWGTAALGMYSRAYSLLMMPINAIRGPINAVAFPAMSSLISNPKEYRHYYKSMLRVLAFLTMPMAALLYVCSESLINLALGPQWAEVSTLFSILAIAGFVQPVSSQRGLVLLSHGAGRKYLTQGIIAAVVTCSGFLAGIPFGAKGVAIGYVIAVWVIAYPLYVYSIKGTSLKKLDLARAVASPAILSVFAAAITYVITILLFANQGSLPKLISQLAIFSCVFLAPLLLTKYFSADRNMAMCYLRQIAKN